MAIIVPNRQEMLELFLGLAKADLIQAPLNYWLKSEFLRRQLVDSGATVLVADNPGIRSALPMIDQTPWRQSALSPIAISYSDGPGRPGTSGHPVRGVEVRIVDDDGADVSTGTVGEIIARPTEPDLMFLGYWQRAVDTVSAWQDLWHHTGDIGRVDSDSFIIFVDRKKDPIRRRGETGRINQNETTMNSRASTWIRTVFRNDDRSKLCSFEGDSRSAKYSISPGPIAAQRGCWLRSANRNMKGPTASANGTNPDT